MTTKTLRYVDSDEVESTFQYDKVVKGTFSTVYLSNVRHDRVAVVVDDDCYDKEIVMMCHQDDPDNPHIPTVHLEGYVGPIESQKKVYLIKRYQKLQTNSQAKRDYNRIKKLLGPVTWAFANPYHGSDRLRAACDILEKCDESDKPAMALLEICRWALNYGDEMTFEYGFRNIMQDEDGNIVWLDMVFDEKALAKIRSAKDKAKHAKYEHLQIGRQFA